MIEQEYHEEIMKRASRRAERTMALGVGGPFGAAIVRMKPDGSHDIVVASNSVLATHDPTAHAEVNVIRLASQKFETHDLSDCILYATSAPCPMCRAAILWANIKTLYYANESSAASEIGFRDDWMYEYFSNGANDELVLEEHHIESESCQRLMSDYVENSGEMY